MEAFQIEAMDPFPFDDERNKGVLGYDNSPEVITLGIELQQRMYDQFIQKFRQ